MRAQIIIALVIAFTCFEAGRFSAPEKIKTEKVTVTDNSYIEKLEQESNRQKIITEVKHPDGTIIYRTRYIKINTDIKSSSKEEATITSEKKEVSIRRGVLVSLLLGTPISLSPTLAYGVSLTKQVLGPINIGAWGLQQGLGVTAGLSLGTEF